MRDPNHWKDFIRNERHDGFMGLYMDHGRRKRPSWVSRRAVACVIGAALCLIMLAMSVV